MVHYIRLRNPWTCEQGAEGWQLLRRFQSPTGVGPQDKLWLEVHTLNLPQASSIRLNGECLGTLVPQSSQRFLMSGLQPVGNCITLTVPMNGEPELAAQQVPGAWLAEVRLAIETANS